MPQATLHPLLCLASRGNRGCAHRAAITWQQELEHVQGVIARVTRGASKLTESVPVPEGACWATPVAPV